MLQKRLKMSNEELTVLQQKIGFDAADPTQEQADKLILAMQAEVSIPA